MTLKERLRRSNNEDILYVGELLETHLQNTGIMELLEYLIQDKNMEELVVNKNGYNADRILGRIEMGARILLDLKNYIAEKKSITRPIKRRRRGKLTAVADDPEPLSDDMTQYSGQV